MRKTIIATLATAAAFFPIAAMAQEEEAPDGTPAFGFEPYVAVMGGYASYDRPAGNGIPDPANGSNLNGVVIEGLAGVNVPLDAFFVGIEGSVAKGIDGDIDWQYGVAGRAGLRAGESGMIYGKVGYEWVNFDHGEASGDYGDMLYGLGVEVGPGDIGLSGITGEAGPRLRLELTTHDMDSIRPMGGLVFQF